jgi:hypothetical protein
MADRLPPGQGALQNWNNINPNKPEEYSSEFTIGGNKFANVTNVSTGQRQLYFVQPVSGARGTPITTTNADGIITRGGNYNNFNQFNPGKLATAEAASKQASVKLLSTPGISTPAEAAAIKNSKEFKSTTAGQNSASGSGTETGAAPANTGNPIGGTKTKEFGNFIYPIGLGKTKQDVVKFSMLQYSPSGLRGGERTAPKSRTIGTVVLPIPNGISDTNSVDWGQSSLNAVEAAAAAAAFTSITDGLGKGIKEAGDSFNKFLGEGETKKGVAALFTSAAVGTAGAQVLSRTSGSVINPNLELLFNGPQLRPFQFTFKLSARSEDESKEIIKILNFFKRGMSPMKTDTNLFLKAPNTFNIQYLHLGRSGNDHPYIGRIKECALQSVTTNYTPEGQYATFSDGVMVSYQLTMQFQELEPVFNNDYDGIEGIGF